MSTVTLLPLLALVVAIIIALSIARFMGKASQGPALREQESIAAQAEQSARQHRLTAVEATRRAERAETIARDLEKSLAELPEIAQRLSATRNLREIPERALELVQELFRPQYAIFYRCARESVVAVATLGDSEYAVGHRLDLGQGIVGWTAAIRNN